MIRRIASVFTVVLVLGGAARIAAQPAPSADKRAEAKRHFDQGVALYNDGNFNAALAEFRAAYQLAPSSALLYNIGLTQKSLFRYNDAIESLERYVAEEPRLQPARRAEVQQLVTEMKALLAQVTIEVTPPGAGISLDGRAVGTAPMKPYGIAAGGHVIEATLEGYRPARREIIVSAGVPLSVKLRLDVIPKSGRVHITASQPMAAVKVDDQPRGFAPIDLELGLGGHSLEVSAAGFSAHRSELVIAAGQNRAVNVTLEKPQKLYKKWYVWTPVGLLLAGGAGVAAYFIVTSAESPIKGSLSPQVGKVNP